MTRELIGREVSLPVENSRRRERGYVSEAIQEGLVVHLYPEADEDPVERIVSVGQLRVLKGGPLPGWYALHLLTQDGEPHISLRLRPHIIAAIKEIAKARGTGLEETINHLLHTGLDIGEHLGSH